VAFALEKYPMNTEAGLLYLGITMHLKYAVHTGPLERADAKRTHRVYYMQKLDKFKSNKPHKNENELRMKAKEQWNNFEYLCMRHLSVSQ